MEGTNYDNLMAEGGEGGVPGERSVEVFNSAASTPRRPVDVVREDLVNLDSPVAERRVEEHPSLESMAKTLKDMVELQAITQDRSAKTMDRHMETIERLATVMTDKARGEKRMREDTQEERMKGESPVMIDYKALEMGRGKDDAHNTICWEVRKTWRMVNKDPLDYWKGAEDGKCWPIRVEPNLAGQVYLEHLVPNLVGDKALSWVHDASRTPDVRSFLHSNSRARSKKAQRTEVVATQSDSASGGMHIDSFVTWAEAGSVKEIVEAVHNYTAALFMVRPWDYSGLVILRCLHDVAFFAITSRSPKEQKELVLEFIDAAFVVNSRQMTKGKHPLTLKEAMELAMKKVSQKNGLGNNLTAQCDIYGLHGQLRAKDEELKKSKDEVAKLKKQLQEEKSKQKKTAYDDHRQRRDGRSVEAGGAGKTKAPQSYYDDRRKACLHYNNGDCRLGAACTRGDHLCSALVGKKMCASADHCRSTHV